MLKLTHSCWHAWHSSHSWHSPHSSKGIRLLWLSLIGLLGILLWWGLFDDYHVKSAAVFHFVCG